MTLLEDTSSPRDEATHNDSLARLREVMQHLTDRERFVIDRLFSGWRLHQVGDKLGVTKERVRQMKVKSLAKLRQYMEGVEPLIVARGPPRRKRARRASDDIVGPSHRGKKSAFHIDCAIAA